MFARKGSSLECLPYHSSFAGSSQVLYLADVNGEQASIPVSYGPGGLQVNVCPHLMQQEAIYNSTKHT